MRRLSLLAALAVVGGCRDEVRPRFVERLMDDVDAWTFEEASSSVREEAEVFGDRRPAWRMSSGAGASRRVDLVSQPCWLQLEACSVPAAGESWELPAVELQVKVAGDSMFAGSPHRDPALRPSGFGSVLVDLSAWSGETVEISVSGTTADARDWWLAGPRVEPHEVYDNRYRTVVLVVLDGAAMADADGWADAQDFPALQRLARNAVLYEEVHLPSVDMADNAAALFGELCELMSDRHRECFAYSAVSPEELGLGADAGFDRWCLVDPWLPLDDPVEGPTGLGLDFDRERRRVLGEGALLRGFGRPRPQSIFVLIASSARGAALDAGFRRLCTQLEADGLWERCTLAVTTAEPARRIDGVFGTSLFLKFPAGDPQRLDDLPLRVRPAVAADLLSPFLASILDLSEGRETSGTNPLRERLR